MSAPEPTRLTLLPDNLTVMVQPGEAILDAMRAAGLGCRFSCRRGGCGICKVDLHEGSVHYDVQIAETVMSEEEFADGTVLACRAKPDGDVAIELRDQRILVKSSLLFKLREAKDAEPESA